VTRICATLVGLGLLATAAGCDGAATSVPTRLVDGSLARSPPVTLQGVTAPAILTIVRRVKATSVRAGSEVASCLDLPGSDVSDSFVERVGSRATSVTVLAAGGRAARGCDRDGGGSWCGRAFGRIEAGRLRDPRLSLTCRDATGAPIGVVWVQPRLAARYVVVENRGYAEVYPTTAGGEPVRVTTSEIDLAASKASARISEYAGDGRRLSVYTVDGRVAG
jgi:hypothetical protein